MKPKGNNPKRSRMKLFILGLIVLSVGLAAWGGYTFYKNTSLNYAEEVARPLEEALVKAGGVKRCESGDGGRGWDNRTPYYGATFELSKDRLEAVRVLHNIASANGYDLTHASPANRGFLDSVADIHIDNWYFDASSKDSPYKKLEQDKIKLSAAIYGEGEKNDCDKSIIKPGQSTIGIGVRLPDLKRDQN